MFSEIKTCIEIPLALSLPLSRTRERGLKEPLRGLFFISKHVQSLRRRPRSLTHEILDSLENSRSRILGNRIGCHGRIIVFVDAHELLHSRLDIVEDCVDALIAGDPIRPLPRAEWFDAVDRLISEVDVELERAAA